VFKVKVGESHQKSTKELFNGQFSYLTVKNQHFHAAFFESLLFKNLMLAYFSDPFGELGWIIGLAHGFYNLFGFYNSVF